MKTALKEARSPYADFQAKSPVYWRSRNVRFRIFSERSKHAQASPFTSHISRPQWRRFGSAPSEITIFELRLTDIQALRDATVELIQLSRAYDAIATFASGGISILEHLVAQEWMDIEPSNPFIYDSELRKFGSRFHLFPGLNWNDQNKHVFDTWLMAQPVGSRLFLFDTGTKGNGARQIKRQVEGLARTFQSFGPSLITIVGLVDGVHVAQRDETSVIERHGMHAVSVRISYRHVPRIFTEDCGVLCGYEVPPSKNGLLPILDPGQVRVLDGSGKMIYRSTSTSIASTYRSTLLSPPTLSSNGRRSEVQRDHVPDAIRRILAATLREEQIRLHQAWCMGLVSDRSYIGEKRKMPRRYASAFDRQRWPVWSFEKKAFVRERASVFQA